MTAREIIYDVKEIKGRITDDSDLDENWLLHKFNNYRETIFVEKYRQLGEFSMSWVQRHPKFKFEKINAADDPSINYSSVTLGKFVLPRIVDFPDDNGLVAVMPSGGIKSFSMTDFMTLMMRINARESITGKDLWVARSGSIIYCYPYTPEGTALFVAYNPMEVPLYKNGTLSSMDVDDDYPVDGHTAQMAILQILTNDLNINDKKIADVVNDSQDQLNIVRNAYAGHDR